MDQALNPFLELDKHTVIGDRHDLAHRLVADRITIGDGCPRILPKLLDTQRDAIVFLIVFQHTDLDLITDLE